MIRLDATTRKLQIILAGAITTNQLPVTVCYSDKTSTTYTGGAQVANTNSTTAVDICAAPAASTVRDIDTINVQNADTVAATATIRYNDNGTTYTLFKAALDAGDQLTYVHGQGWSVLDSTGAIKGGGSGGSISDGDKGDITVSSSGATWTVDNDAITYAKMQNVSATGKLLGRSTAGAGDVEEIACTAAGRALLDDADATAQRGTLGAAASGANADITSLTALTSINGGPISGLHNVIINGGFTINQRSYVSGAALAAGSYGHDRFKAGASGGDYSFTQLASSTTITIASGKSLIQVVEDKNVGSTSYVLSWTGTAQARYAVNSATPAGSYAASPILITGQTAGTVMSVEFNTGTLGKVQLEPGAVATSFESRPYSLEFALCQRYAQRLSVGTVALLKASYCYRVSTNIADAEISFNPEMRATPTLVTNGAAFSTGITGNVWAVYNNSATGFVVAVGAVTLTFANGSMYGGILRTAAATTLSGTSGQLCSLYFGNAAIIVVESDL